MEEYKRSVYDAMVENFKVAGRRHFLHRIIVIGEHKFDEPRDALMQYMAQKIKTLHEGYRDENLTGYLLAYPAHFVHLVEGSENTLMEHFRNVCEDDEQFGRIKLLIVSYHINRRYYSKWGFSICHPPVLFEKLDPECPREEIARQTKICIDKMLRLTKTFLEQSTITLGDIGETLSEKYPAMLPECALLDFLMATKSLRDFRKYTKNYRTALRLSLYSTTVWPVACEYIPTNVLDSLPIQKPDIADVEGGVVEDDLQGLDTIEAEGEPGDGGAEDLPESEAKHETPAQAQND